MTNETPTPESPGAGPNWMMIGIVAALVVAAILIVFSLLNRSGAQPDAEPTVLPPVAARITIDQPANGAVLDLAAPIPVSGTGEGLPEGNVVVEALDAAGNVLATQPTTVTASDAGTGGAGPWSTQLTVDVAPGTTGSIRAFSPSPADGSILADVSVSVNYGEAAAPVQASLSIAIPHPGESISAQQAVVVGQGAALPENNVVVRALDANGNVLAEQPTLVEAEVGGSGEWRVTLDYTATPDTPGQIYAFATSPADGSVIAEAAVDIRFGAVAQPAIAIDAPQNGAVVDPTEILVSGTGTALPENNVVVRALDANGAVLVEQPTVVNAGIGGSGPWSVTLAVDAPGGMPGRIDAFSASPADGSVLAQAGVDIQYGEATQPVITISEPQSGAVVDPAAIVVSGSGSALPENNVVVQALDAGGNVLVQQATVVNAEIGGTGLWSVTLAANAPAGSPGQIYAFSPSPADGSILAEARVEIQVGGAAQPAIAISAPESGAVVDPAAIVVNGTGTALPENNVVVRAVDADGNVLAEQPATVNAELGGSGPWTVTLAVEAGEDAPGRIEAFSTSPADGTTVAQAAVDIVYGRPRD